MNRHFRNKEDALNSARGSIDAQVDALHPTDKAEVYRTIEKEAGEAATSQEETNERVGVPEREEDQGKTCLPDNNISCHAHQASLAHGAIERPWVTGFGVIRGVRVYYIGDGR